MKVKSNVLMTSSIIALVAAGCLIIKGTDAIATVSQSQDQHKTHKLNAEQTAEIEKFQERPGTIKGSDNPGAIPDHVAFELFLRSLVPQSNDPLEQKRVRLYARDAGFVGGEEDILLKLALDFNNQISLLDSQAAAIKHTAWPNPSDNSIRQLKRLDDERVVLVKKFMETLPDRLGANAEIKRNRAEKVDRYVKDEVRRKIRLNPSDLSQKN